MVSTLDTYQKMENNLASAQYANLELREKDDKIGARLLPRTMPMFEVLRSAFGAPAPTRRQLTRRFVITARSHADPDAARERRRTGANPGGTV